MNNLFNLNLNDFFKGLVVAVLSAVLQFLYQLIVAHGFDITKTDLQQLLSVAALAGLSYLAKNFLTDKSTGKFIGKI